MSILSSAFLFPSSSHFPSQKAQDPSAIAKGIDFFLKLIVSPLFWSTYGTLAAIGFFIEKLAGWLLSSSIFVDLIAIGLLVGAALFIYRNRHTIFYELSLLFVALRNFFTPKNHPWFNQIDENLYLGGMPLHEMNHLKKILRTTNISAILSVTEDFELQDRWPFTTPISHEEWQQKGFEAKRVGAVDLEGVKLENIDQAISFIREMLLKGRPVYVHCKAGLGRSATVIACYLLKYGCKNGQTFHSVEEAIEFVLKKRSKVLLKKQKSKTVIEQYFNTIYQK